MDDTAAVRELLDLAARDEDAPPCRVSVGLARSRGRRRRRLLRLYLPAAAPVAAAVAVALVVTVSAGLRGGPAGGLGPQRPEPAANAPFVAPRSFNPLVPYASFGWLPADFSTSAATGAADESTGSSVTLQAVAPLADGRMVNATVDAAGACRVVSTAAWLKSLPARRRQSLALTSFTGRVLSCTDASAGSANRLAELGSAAPDVNGRSAYWTPQGALEFEYAAGAWAEVMPMANPKVCVHCAPNNLAGWGTVFSHAGRKRGGGTASPATVVEPESAASQALLLKIAATLRYGDTVPLVFGFRLASLPAGWQVAGDYYFTPQAGRLVASGLSAGPAVDPMALSVSVGPAVPPTSQYACKVIPGQTSPVTIDGAPALVRYLNEPDKQFQSLCANDIDGVSPYLALDLNVPGSNAPLPGGNEVSSVLTVFRSVQLLGPDPAAWITDPLG